LEQLLKIRHQKYNKEKRGIIPVEQLLKYEKRNTKYKNTKGEKEK